MNQRIIGFDLARAFAIFGMFIVNFNTVFGSQQDTSPLGRFLTLFNGNSSTLFVMLAGMGVALMTNRATYTDGEKQQLRGVVIRRSWFLFAIGLLLYAWWPADILHFYGGYMHLAALVLFVPLSYYLAGAALTIVSFHLLLLLIPYETGWNFDTLQYTDFWTVPGFLRNTLYNGWNALFPWMAYFFLGMWLGRLNWQNKGIRKRLFIGGLVVYGLVQVLQWMAANAYFDPDTALYLTADYLPPFLPFMLGTASLGVMMVIVCLTIGELFANNRLIHWLARTGQMTLTHYIVHLTLGMVVSGLLTGRSYEGRLNQETAISPGFVFAYAIGFYSLSVLFSLYWSRKHKTGPFETLMRRLTNS